jgi:hypothetical protein
MPFTPTANATVMQIQVAVHYRGSGTNGFNLVLAADDGYGAPGKTLHSWDLENLVEKGTCCKLATAKYANGIKVQKGKQYWVLAQTDSKSQDSEDGWAFTWNDAQTTYVAFNFGEGWEVYSYGPPILAAFAVQGK